jgi:hypothetical protein
MSRYKRINGDTLRSIADRPRRSEPISPSSSSTTCSTSGARTPSVPLEDQRTRAILRSPASVQQNTVPLRKIQDTFNVN